MAIRAVLPAAATFLVLVAVAFDRGGYFPGPWGWTTAIAAWIAIAAVLTMRRLRPSRPALAVAALLGAFVVWALLSSLWSLSPTASVLGAQRVAVYAAAFLALALWARRSTTALLAVTWLAITVACAWSLLTRLVPDRFGVDYVGSGPRLSAPIGYWNSLAIYAAMGALLALALAADGRTRVERALAAASVPVLVTTIYFTYSRGAWLSLAAGIVVLLGSTVRRVRVAATSAALGAIAALLVWRASTTRSLTTSAPSLRTAAHDGHWLLLGVIVAAIVSGCAAWLLVRHDDRLFLPERWRRQARIGGAGAALVAVVVVTAVLGSPSTIARKGWHAFAGPNAAPTSTLNGHLFSFNGTGRVNEWRVAWREARAHPLAGTGSGTYEIAWNRLRPDTSRVRDTHNLYLQTLAELGIVGAALLVAALGIPLATGVALRRRPLLAGALAAYAAFLVHGVVDWDWQLTGVTLPALVCAAALTRTPARALRRRGRRIVGGCAAALALLGFVAIAQRLPLNRLDDALAHQRWAHAEHEARTASDLAPWSSEPWLKLGEGELAAGLTPQANAAFTRAVAKDRNNWVAWWDLARSARDGQRVDALLHVRLLNPLAPSAPEP